MTDIQKTTFKWAAILLAGGVVTAITFAPAFAGDCQRIGDACDTQRVQTSKPDYVGKLAPTPTNVVCLTALATEPSGLVLAEGRVAENEEVTGKVITSWRTQRSLWKKTAHGYVREICIPSSMVKGTVTLCNEENRSIWTTADTAYLRRVKRIPANNPACLLGKKACAAIGL
ncbi:hypothetical protein CL653_02145 [bacterium]|nr:hypothetical protein [bacterium]